MSADDVMNELATPISERLKDSNLNFALVLWVDGKAGEAESVAVAYHPTVKKSDAALALRTTANQIDP